MNKDISGSEGGTEIRGTLRKGQWRAQRKEEIRRTSFRFLFFKKKNRLFLSYMIHASVCTCMHYHVIPEVMSFVFFLRSKPGAHCLPVMTRY